MDSIFDRLCVAVGLALILFGAATVDSLDQTIPFCTLGAGVVFLLPALIKSIKDGDQGR